MNELSIPLPSFGDSQVADVEVTINGKKKKYHYRLEAFPWEPDSEYESNLNEIVITELKIIKLKSLIDKYDKGWELIQIYNPGPKSKHIHVLFRKKAH